jgi:hypothetical protein
MEFALTRAKRGMPPTRLWQRLDIHEILDAYTINRPARLHGRHKSAHLKLASRQIL